MCDKLVSMRGYMFRNRWLALLFVSMVLAGVTRIVGTEEDDGAIVEAGHRLAEQRAQAEKMTRETAPQAEESNVQYVFTPDDELVDATIGDDPTPVDEFAAAQLKPEEVVADGQVVIVNRDGGQQTGQ